MKYLPVSVYTNTEFGDCSNNGVTVTDRNNLVIECEDGFISEESVIATGKIILIPRTINNHTYFVAKGQTRHTMAGGNFVYSSDSRFRKLFPAPVPVHDRIE